MSATIGERIREAREYVGIHLVAAASAAGLGDAELQALESGERDADPHTLERLALACGYSRGYFLRQPEALDEAGVAVVARLGDLMTDHDRREALLFACYLRDAADD